MLNFELNGKTFNLPTSWDDITLGMYIELSRLNEMNSLYQFNELLLIKMLEVMCCAEEGELDDLTLERMTAFGVAIEFLNQIPEFKIIQHLQIEDKDYAFPENLYKIKAGEYISIKTLQENQKDPYNFYLDLLSILLRPATEIVDAESGQAKWIQEKLNVDNLEYRKKLFKNLKVVDVMGSLNFFLSGKNS